MANSNAIVVLDDKDKEVGWIGLGPSIFLQHRCTSCTLVFYQKVDVTSATTFDVVVSDHVEWETQRPMTRARYNTWVNDASQARDLSFLFNCQHCPQSFSAKIFPYSRKAMRLVERQTAEPFLWPGKFVTWEAPTEVQWMLARWRADSTGRVYDDVSQSLTYNPVNQVSPLFFQLRLKTPPPPEHWRLRAYAWAYWRFKYSTPYSSQITMSWNAWLVELMRRERIYSMWQTYINGLEKWQGGPLDYGTPAPTDQYTVNAPTARIQVAPGYYQSRKRTLHGMDDTTNETATKRRRLTPAPEASIVHGGPEYSTDGHLDTIPVNPSKIRTHDKTVDGHDYSSNNHKRKHSGISDYVEPAHSKRVKSANSMRNDLDASYDQSQQPQYLPHTINDTIGTIPSGQRRSTAGDFEVSVPGSKKAWPVVTSAKRARDDEEGILELSQKRHKVAHHFESSMQEDYGRPSECVDYVPLCCGNEQDNFTASSSDDTEGSLRDFIVSDDDDATLSGSDDDLSDEDEDAVWEDDEDAVDVDSEDGGVVM